MELRNTEMQLRNTVEINKKGVSGIKRGGTITFLVKHNTSNSPYIWIQDINKMHHLVCTFVHCTLYVVYFNLFSAISFHFATLPKKTCSWRMAKVENRFSSHSQTI